MNIYKQENGDIELADFYPRTNENWVTLCWYATDGCNLACPYCVGSHLKKNVTPSLLDRYGVDRVVSQFEHFRDYMQKDVYTIVTGGEPSLIPKMDEFIGKMTNKNFQFDFQTNLTTSNIKFIVDSWNKENIGEIMAAYHNWKLDVNAEVREKYIENFKYVVQNGISIICKLVVRPSDVFNMEYILNNLTSLLGADTQFLLNGYIGKGGYPMAYTREEKDYLNELRKTRMLTHKFHQDGGVRFKGMKCGAGSDYFYLTITGNFRRCTSEKQLLGNIMNKYYNIPKTPMICNSSSCSCAAVGAWFGVNPWDYLAGWSEKDCTFNRYHHLGFVEEIDTANNLDLIAEEEIDSNSVN